MSERDALLPQHDDDPEANKPRESNTWRGRVALALESSALHKAVIALIVVDAACVLADLSYTLLSDSCEPPSGPDVPAWLDILSAISTTITTVFLIEIPLTIWSLGVKYYYPAGPVPHASLHLFDAIIILTTFVLEVVLRGRERELAGLLIILRLWRLLKLVGGVAVGAGELEDETIKELAHVKKELEETQVALTNAREDNKVLHARIAAVDTHDANDSQ